MIELVQDEDVIDILKANSALQATNVILAIINRMYEPRVYLCEPDPRMEFRQRQLWATGFEMLTRELLDQQVSIVDPETIRSLGSIRPDLEQVLRNQTDPLFYHLIRKGWLDEVFLPHGKPTCRQHMNARRSATAHNLIIRTWRPTLEPLPGKTGTRAVRPPSRPTSP